MLRYSIVDGSVVGPLPTESHPRGHAVKPHLFRVDAKSGEVSGFLLSSPTYSNFLSNHPIFSNGKCLKRG